MEQAESVSTFNPLAAAVLVVMLCLIWALPRRYAVCPLLTMTCLMPMGQELAVFGLHFHFFRLLLLVGMIRVFLKGEMAQLVLTRPDKLIIGWAAVTVLLGTLSKPSAELFVNRLGDAYNALGTYFFCRCVLAEIEDLVTSVRTLAWLSLPVAGLMMVEKTTSHNLLSVFGGVPEITFVREGHLRCQGAFRHPILAGSFGAAHLPLFVALWFYKPTDRRLAVAAMVAGLAIVIAASSSGALLGLMAGVAGLAFWKHRRYARALRWGVVAVICVLAVVMKAPVWYLVAKLSDVTGGGGWHRAWLIDQAVTHFDEWWLFGTTYTAHWGPAGEVIAADPDMMDITNHYVMEGVKGGILKLGLFIAIIAACFGSVERGIRAQVGGPTAALFVWGLGVALFVHCVSFVSITYFDQSIVLWFWLLAAIGFVGHAASQISVPLDEVGEAGEEPVSTAGPGAGESL